MKSILGIALLIFVGAVGWQIGGQLSPDALGMAVGILFGVMAGIPTALLVLASERRPADYDSNQRRQEPRQIEQQPPAPPQQVTNNYITHNHLHVHSAPGRSRQAEVEQRHNLPAPRQFRIIGDMQDEQQ